MSNVLVSVVIPTYGRPRQLQACLESLAGQSLRPDQFEVLVIDDGSPEPIHPVAMAFAGRLHVRVIRQANAGPAAARNRGVAESSAPRVAFTDDDCRPTTDWLAQLLAASTKHPGALVGGATLHGLPEDLFATTSQLVVDLVYEHFNADPANALFLASNNFLCGRDHFIRIGGFDAGFPRAGAEDRDFCDRWRCSGGTLLWCREAEIVHEHPQTLRKFIDLHGRYGRGAFIYHARRRSRRSGSTWHDARFHASLPRLLWERRSRLGGVGHAMGIVGALVLWQVANAVGFAWQALAELRQGRRVQGPKGS